MRLGQDEPLALSPNTHRMVKLKKGIAARASDAVHGSSDKSLCLELPPRKSFFSLRASLLSKHNRIAKNSQI